MLCMIQLLGLGENSQAINIHNRQQTHYKSDEVDDLLEGVITNKHVEKHEMKELGPTDELVKEVYDKSMEASKEGDKYHYDRNELIDDMDVDIYATEKKEKVEPLYKVQNYEKIDEGQKFNELI